MTGAIAVCDANILVVDDTAADARLVEAMLNGAGYRTVTTTGDPFDAVDLHAEHRFDLIIVDVFMPGMDGFELMKRLRAIEPEAPVPVIVVTAEPEHMTRALEEGARDFICKPLRTIELSSRVRSAIELGWAIRAGKAHGRALEQKLDQRTADLEDAQGRFQALVEQSIAGIYIVEDGRFTYCNPRMCEFLGYSAQELEGMETLSLVVPEQREAVLEARRRRDAGEANTLLATYRLMRKDGQVVHLSLDARMLDLRGRRMIFGIAQDVTEREHSRRLLKEAERHYSALVEQSIVGIYLSVEMQLIYANPRLREILGYSLEELARVRLRDLALPEDRGAIDQMRLRREAGERGTISLRFRARRGDGVVVNLLLESRTIEVAGRPGVIGVVQDMTLHDQAQEALRAANQRLQTLSDRVLAVQEEERRRIARELHDDIGQSLVALGIGLHRLAPHLAKSHQALLSDCIELAGEARDKLREISVELHPPHLDQLGLADALRWLVNRHQDITGVEIECRIEGLEGARVSPAAEAACYRICQEALSNATRHARARRITVELALADGALVIRVADDGVGFDAAAKREALVTSGSMGLISMEERARLAGGRFELRTADGAGTCVSAVFPIDAPARESARKEVRV